MNSSLDIIKLGLAIKTKRGGNSLKQVEKEIGTVSSATLSRIENGFLPDVTTFIKVCKWLEMNVDSFVKTETDLEIEKETDEQKIVYQLRASKALKKDTVDAIVTMVKIAFETSK